MTFKDKIKAVAGALTGFLTSLSTHLIDGAPITAVITSGEVLIQAVVTAAVGYAIVYFSPKNA